MNRMLARYLAAHAPQGTRWRAARRLPDALGRGTPAARSPRRLPWAALRIVEHHDRARGLCADHATDMSARAVLADRPLFRGRSVCEVGCGTAALSALCARLGAARVVGIDCDPQALRLADRTVRENRIPAFLRQGDLLAGTRERFDVLIANLPQKPTPRGARLPLGQDGGPGGDVVLRRFLAQAPRRLTPRGRLYLFLHTLTPPAALGRLGARFGLAIPFWRRRLVPPGEYPSPLLAEWRARSEAGTALFHPIPDRPGWHAFYCLQVVAVRR